MPAYEEIEKLFTDFASGDYIGEAVSIEEHHLQCGKCAMMHDETDEEAILAALLHDVGHLLGMRDNLEQMDDVGTAAHEKVGADWVRSLGASERLASIIERHVDAKRYFTATQPSYYNNLTEASKKTLGFQGGPMTPEEVERFETDPLKKVILLMRTWDEKAKVVGWKVPTLDYYRDMIQRNFVHSSP